MADIRIENRLAFERGELLSKRFAPENVKARHEQRYDGVVGEINRWVDDVRARTGEAVPYADPAAATDGVRILLLFQDPSEAAETGSGFISRHNNDPTARNAYEAHELAGINYSTALHWNVVPWWASKNPAFPTRTAEKEAPRARPFLMELLGLINPAPSVVVVSGGAAQRAWKTATSRGLPDHCARLEVLQCPHPSPLSYPRTDKKTGLLKKSIIIDTFRRAQQSVDRS